MARSGQLSKFIALSFNLVLWKLIVFIEEMRLALWIETDFNYFANILPEKPELLEMPTGAQNACSILVKIDEMRNLNLKQLASFRPESLRNLKLYVCGEIW